MPALQVSRPGSLIADRICSLGYVTRAGYRDGGQGVTILVFHDDDPDRVGETIGEIGRRGREIGGEVPDRMISPLSIHDGPDVLADVLRGYEAVHMRETRL